MPATVVQVSSRRTINKHIIQNHQEATNIRITQQTKLSFQDYARRKLYIAGYTADGGQTPNDVSYAVQQMAFSLETNYPNLFTNISRQVNSSLSNESIVYEVFTEFAQAMFRDGVSWNRIIALFAFAGALTLECHQLGAFRQPVNKVSEWMGDFTTQFLAEWIHHQGGWDAFLEVFPVHASQQSTLSKCFQVVGEWIAYIFRLSTTGANTNSSTEARTS